jgi:hypothetical protein
LVLRDTFGFMRDASDFHRWQLDVCNLILNIDNEALQYIGKQEDWDKKQTANWTKYEKCHSEAGAFLSDGR